MNFGITWLIYLGLILCQSEAGPSPEDADIQTNAATSFDAVNQTSCAANQTGCVANQTGCMANQTSCTSNQTCCASNQTICAANQTCCTLNQTGCMANQTYCAVNQTGCVANQTFCASNQTSCAANHTGCVVNQICCVSNQTGYVMNQTSYTANQTDCVPNQFCCASNQTSCVANQTGCVVNQTCCVSNQTGCVTNQTSCMANQTGCMVNQTCCAANQTYCVSNQTDCAANHTDCIANQTCCVSNQTGCMANETCCMANQTGCATNHTACAANHTSCATNYTGCVANQTNVSNSSQHTGNTNEICEPRRILLSADLQEGNTHNVSQFNDFCDDKKQPPIPPPGPKVLDDFACVKTAANGYVAMKSSCGVKWDRKNIITNYCEKPHPSNSNLWYNVPVNRSGITYKNIFCMICQDSNSSSEWNLWDLGFSCVNQTTGLRSQKYVGVADASELQPYSSGFWNYTHAGGKFICYAHPIAKSSNYSRCYGCQNKTQCYNSSGITYSYSYISGNKSREPQSSSVNLMVSVMLFRDKMPPFSDCNKIPDDIRENHTEIISFVCSGQTKHPWTETKNCSPNNQNINVNSEVEIINNEMVSKSLRRKYRENEWFFISERMICLCQDGHAIEKNNRVLPGLLKIVLVLIVAYLLLFYWLPEKNLWDKILAALGIALAIQLWCVAFDVSWPFELLGNRLWNFSLLSCSIWILILFYDFRRSLHIHRRVYVGTNSANKTFYWYLFAYAVMFALVVVPFYHHHPKTSLGVSKHEHLLQTSSSAAFWASASVYIITCGIVVETIDRLYRDHQLYSSRQHLNLPARLILTMVLIWMIASLVMLGTSDLPNWLFYILNLVQALFYIIFIYFEIRKRVKREFNNRDTQFHPLPNDANDTAPILTIQLSEEPRRTENATFYTGKL